MKHRVVRQLASPQARHQASHMPVFLLYLFLVIDSFTLHLNTITNILNNAKTNIINFIKVHFNVCVCVCTSLRYTSPRKSRSVRRCVLCVHVEKKYLRLNTMPFSLRCFFSHFYLRFRQITSRSSVIAST